MTRTNTCHHCRATRNPYQDPDYKRTRRILIAEWVRQQGWQCPGITTGRLVIEPHPSRDLTIDHIDRDPYNNQLTNLRVLCRSCNLRHRHL